MRNYIAIIAAATFAVLPLAAGAQTMASAPAAASITATKAAQLTPFVNQYVYATDGSVAGILHHLRGGNEAVIAVSEFTGAAPMVAVPLSNLDVMGGKVVIHNASFASLSNLPSVY